MAETDFFQYLADSMRTMLTIRAEELVKVTYSKAVYTASTTELRSQTEIDSIVSGMREPIEQLTDQYLCEMRASGLTSPELVKANGQKLREITSMMERKMEEQLKSRLGCNDY